MYWVVWRSFYMADLLITLSGSERADDSYQYWSCADLQSALFETSNKNKSLIADYAALKKAFCRTRRWRRIFPRSPGNWSYWRNFTLRERNFQLFLRAGGEPLPALKLGSFDKIIAGSDLLG